MSFSGLFTWISILLFASVPTIFAASGFVHSCPSWSGSGTILSATCSTISGSTLNSSLDLNTCVTNMSGMLAFQVNGNFKNSCSNISINSGLLSKGDTAYLSASCSNVQGTKFDTAIDLGNFVGNSNGVLTCS